jgi:hypothetical protein
MQHFGMLYQTTDSIESRNKRLQLNKSSLRTELLEQRSRVSNVEFRYIMQGDFTLFLRDATLALQSQSYRHWWPETLIYAERLGAPFANGTAGTRFLSFAKPNGAHELSNACIGSLRSNYFGQ